MTIGNLFFNQFQKINYSSERSSISDISIRADDNIQGSFQNRPFQNHDEDLINNEIATLENNRDVLFFGKLLLGCTTVVGGIVMGLIFYFNPGSVITIPVIAGFGGGCLVSLGLLCAYDNYNDKKIVKKKEEKNLLNNNIYSQGTRVFEASPSRESSISNGEISQVDSQVGEDQQRILDCEVFDGLNSRSNLPGTLGDGVDDGNPSQDLRADQSQGSTNPDSRPRMQGVNQAKPMEVDSSLREISPQP